MKPRIVAPQADASRLEAGHPGRQGRRRGPGVLGTPELKRESSATPIWRGACACLALLVVGCRLPGGSAAYDRALPPTFDRLVAAYEDLASQRFEILADFESPEQATLFHVEPDSAGGARMSTERSRRETGAGALKMTFVSSGQRVIAADTAASRWALVRDWSRYDLLLMSVFSPRRLGGFTITIRSGTSAPLSWTLPRIFLNPGWNLVRIDLGDFAEQVNLLDVREMRLGCDPLEAPVDLYLDDVLLVSNARDVFGSADGAAGQLYARTQGRRLAVGAVGRFEVVFSRGQLRQWYDVGKDTARLHNLCGRGPLGPIPVVLPDPEAESIAIDDASQWAGLGIAAELHQTLLEATSLMARVQGQIRFSSIDQAPDEGSPAHRWLYTIYRDGRIYVDCSGTARSTDFSPAAVGIAFACDAGAGFRRRLGRAVQTRPEGPSGHSAFALFSRPDLGAADLLVSPASPLPARGIENAQESRAGVLWVLGSVQDTFGFAAMLRVWPTDIDSAAQADPMSDDYQHPLPIGLEVGQLARTDPGDLNADGFSESAGCYLIQLDGSIARIRIPGQSRLRFSPVFKVIDVAGRDVWAYLDGRQIKEVLRDVDGNAMFMLPDILTRESLLEITSRARDKK